MAVQLALSFETGLDTIFFVSFALGEGGQYSKDAVLEDEYSIVLKTSEWLHKQMRREVMKWP